MLTTHLQKTNNNVWNKIANKSNKNKLIKSMTEANRIYLEVLYQTLGQYLKSIQIWNISKYFTSVVPLWS